MHILIIGGTGFIGSYLAKKLCEKGSITVTGRDLNFDQTMSPDVIINLAGEPLEKRRWNLRVKQEIYDSRIETTKKIVDYIKDLPQKPKLFLSGSAIGIYGHSLDHVFTENDDISPQDFCQTLVLDWEKEALKAREFGVRVCLLRTGIVLGKNGGALSQMLPAFTLGLGAILGKGDQWMSWVHMDDVVGAIQFLMDHDIHGPVNLTSPTPVTNQTLTKELAKALNRPSFLKFPPFLVRLLFGEMADALLLNGQKVIPQKLQESGYIFKFQDIKTALEDVLI